MEELNASELKKLGKAAIEIGDIYSAIDFYATYCAKKPIDLQAMWQLAELYRLSRDYVNAQDWYLKAYEADNKKYSEGLFHYALMLKRNGHYAEAIEHFNKFKKEYNGDDSSLKKRLKTEIIGCEMAKDMMNDESTTLKVLIHHLDTSINKAHVEFAPLLLDENTLVYASFKEDSLKYYNKLEDTIPVRKFYVAKKNGENEWTGGELFEGPFNKEEIHVGNGTLSLDGNRFYFTRCKSKKGKGIICEIYVSNKKNGKWGEPTPLPKSINNGNTATQPTVGPVRKQKKKKQEVLYFVSDRAEGKGGLDIWYSIYNVADSTYSEVKNGGTKINTRSDEMTPFCDAESNTMYFSSDGLAGLGGLDVFETSGAESKWRPATNVGYPINGGADELYYIISHIKKEEGFFVSNREGGVALKNPTCCDDIYSFVWKDTRYTPVKGKLYDVNFIEEVLDMDDDAANKQDLIFNSDRAKIAGQEVQIYEIAGDGEERYLVNSAVTNENSEFTLVLEKNKRYELVIERSGYFIKHQQFVTKNITKDTLQQHIGLLVLTEAPMAVKNIYYTYNEWYLTDQAKLVIDTTLYKIMIDNPHIVIEIDSHTDDHGAHDFNMKLSQKRAESVVNHLVKKGIKKSRLSAKGLGETKPIASNQNEDGSDNPTGRAKNRRTEFRVISMDDGTEIIYKH
ncbi:MAG: hypothetical protein COA57_03320 [Flavobacteriales bacterium]|nr:MAG: hypothetical protein COA57_03320 [Flavobacteriales bacterium]